MKLPRIALLELAPAAALALAVAFLSTLDDLVGRHPGFDDFSLLFAPAGVTAAYLLLGGAASFVGGWTLGLWRPRWARPLALGAAAALAFYTFFFPHFDAYPAPIPYRSPEATHPLIAAALCVGALVFAVCRRSRIADTRSQSIGVVAASSVVGLALACVFAWTFLYRFGLGASYVFVAGCLAGVLTAAAALGWRGSARLRSIEPGILVYVAFAAAVGWTLTAIRVPDPQPSALAPTSPPVSRIILLTVDTLRADSLALQPTPHIDSLAADSVVFQNAVSGGSWTAPGLASIITGVTPSVHGQLSLTSAPLSEKLPTLGTFFSDAGYVTALIGENPFIAERGMDRGFQWTHTHPNPPASGSFGWRALQEFSERFVFDPGVESLTNWSLAWLRKNADKAFFLWMHVFDPHDPYAPPARFVDASQASPQIGLTYAQGSQVQTHEMTPKQREWIRELYRGEIRWVDEQVGRLLAMLREQGLYEDALIVFTSDHGEEFFEHGNWYHGHSNYQEQLHVPLMIKLPGNSKAKSVNGTVSTISTAPTILDLVQLDHDPTLFSAKSLRAYLEKPEEKVEPHVAFSTGSTRENRLSVVFDRKKYIRWATSGLEETYDLVDDPEELVSPFSEEIARQGRTIIEQRLEADLAIRKRYGLADHYASSNTDPATRDLLESLGYIH